MMNQFADTRVALWTETPGELLEAEIALAHLGCQVLRAESFAQLGQWVESCSIHLIVTWLPREDQSAFEIVTWLEEIPAAPPVLVVGRGLDMEVYLEAMRRGAFDCIESPLDEDELARIVAVGLEASSLRQPA
jgi:DNA-binding NtrC family response regulator